MGKGITNILIQLFKEEHMQKAIHIESSANNIVRVLSIAGSEIIEANPLGLPYFIIEDYTEKPELDNPSLDISYPMYNKTDKKFFWVTVNYEVTPEQYLVEVQNLTNELAIIKASNTNLQEVVDVLLLESLSKTESEVI